MADDAELKRHLLGQLPQTHARFAELMEARLGKAEIHDLERYFGMMSTLVGKLEQKDKALNEVLREMAAEYAAVVLMELNR
jgi:hypothetical protein